MSENRTAQFLADGFEHITTFPVGVPHYVWKADLEVEYDRALRLSEETILRLVDAGIDEPSRIAALMGLDDDTIVPIALLDLLTTGAIMHSDGRLFITPHGKLVLAKATTREVKTYESIDLRHDPYRDELCWVLSEFEYKDKDMRQSSLRPLPGSGELPPALFESRYREVQRLLEREGLPFEDDEQKKQNKKRRREIIRIKASRTYVAYRAAELQVWHQQSRDEWGWCLLRDGGEDKEITDRLVELEAQGQTIIPLEERREIALTRQGEAVHHVVAGAQQDAKPAILNTEEHRQALRDAIAEASSSLIIISPWLRTAAVNEEFIGWIRKALDRHKDLRVTIGYGIEGTGGKPRDAGIRDQDAALKTLRKLVQYSRGRLRIVDIGNTHEKLVICDNRYVIITSFNFLSFNPQPGRAIRREIGHRITDEKTVNQVREQILKALG